MGMSSVMISIKTLSLLLALLPGAQSGESMDDASVPCSVCRDGLGVGWPENTISIPNISGEITCEQLDLLVPSLYPDRSNENCQTLQSLGALCGCQTPVNACTLCKDGAPMAFPERPVKFFGDTVGGGTILPNCEIVDAFLRTSYSEDDTLCMSAQKFLGNYCECVGAVNEIDYSAEPCALCNDGSPITLPDENINIEGFLFSSCKQLDLAASTLFKLGSDQCNIFQSFSTLCGCPKKPNSCAVCADGGPIAFPDKPVRFVKDMFGGIEPSCKVFEAFAQSFDEQSDECHLIQGCSGFCGCAPIKDHCSICDNGKALTREFEEVEVEPHLAALIGLGDSPFAVTCEYGVSLQFQIPAEEPMCMRMQDRQDICGCGDYVYYGAYTERMKSVLFWLPFASAFLSVLGSLAIIVDVIRDATRRRQTYNQLVASMSLFDILSSIGWMLSSRANPIDDAWPIYGEQGNDATCKAQGFFIQLAMTSVLYNMSLTSYYFIAVVLGWRGRKLKAMAPFLHALPLTVGLSLAFAGIPFYDTILGICYIPTPPQSLSWVPSTWIHIVPLFTAITFNCVLLLFIWLKVHQQVAITSTWRLPGSRHDDMSSSQQDLPLQDPPQLWQLSSLQKDWLANVTKRRKQPSERKKKSALTTIQRVERSVVWQALFYVVAFYICWVCQLVLIKRAPQRKMSYSFYCTVMIIIPLQGFLNALNYYRPRIERYFRGRRESRERKEWGDVLISQRRSPDDNNENPRLRFDLHDESSVSADYIGGETSDTGDVFNTILEPSAYLEHSDPSFGKRSTSISDDDDESEKDPDGPTRLDSIVEEKEEEIMEEF